MRQLVLAVAVLFMALLTTLTVLDIVHNGINALDAVAVLILALLVTGILGALRHPPPPE